MFGIDMKQEISKRWQRFQDTLMAHGVEGALIVQKTDLYYFSGTDQDAHLWIPASGPPLLMVRKSLTRAMEDAAIEQIVPLEKFSQIPEYIQHNGGARGSGVIGLEMDVLPVNRYLIYRELFPQKEFVDVSLWIRETRAIKSSCEISLITEAARMADAVYEKIPQFLKESQREIDLTARIEAWYRRRGHPGVIPARGFNTESIYGQIMAGRWAAMPSNSAGPTGGLGLGPFFSQGSSLERIEPHSPVLVDYAANADGYISDQARIFSLGSLDNTLVRAHEAALSIQETLSRRGLPGVMAETLYRLALEIAEAAGLAGRFMGYPDPVPFVGHGVGLELDELPVIGRGKRTLLTEGMVIALEPKFVFPDQGVVGIENTFVVTKDGMEKLNRFPDGIMIC